MRRIGIPVLLALATAGVAGSGTPAAARTPLSVGVDCWTDAGSVICDAVAYGGTGSYVSYDWTVAEGPGFGPPTSSYQVVGSSPALASSCTAGYHVTATVTVRDSGGATATGSSGFTC